MKSLPTVLSLLFFLCHNVMIVESVKGMRVDDSRSCEPIRVEACQGLGYNVTAMPNFAAQDSQMDAEVQINTFLPLIQYDCSSQLRFFLCSVYVPLCTEKVPENIGPCRPLCQTVKNRCNPILSDFGFPWPPALDCDKFPEENNHLHMCMEGPGELSSSLPAPVKPAISTTSTTTTTSPDEDENDEDLDHFVPKMHSPPVQTSNKHHRKKPVSHRPMVLPSNDLNDPVILSSITDLGDVSGVNSISFPKIPGSTSGVILCSMYRHSSEYYFVNRTETCSHKCSSDVLFSSENKDFTEVWLLIWSVVCLLVTMFAIYCFLIDTSQYRYPEKIIVIMSFTYLMYSSGHLIRLVFGRESISCHQEPQYDVSLLITEGPDNFSCTIVFVILYFFSMSSALWWVNLTISWFLSAGLNWSSEAIERKSSYFHLIAWLIPFIKTLAILIMRAVDADELTGSCFIGNHSRGTLLAFVIIPSAFYLLLGSFFLFARLYCFYLSKQMKTCSSLRVRHASHHSSASSHHSAASQTHIPVTPVPTLSHSPLSSCCNPKDKQQLMNWKFCCFTFFYILFSTILLAFNVYEYLERDSWYLNGSPDRPSLELYTTKIFMNFVVGIQCGLWIWSIRTPSGMCTHMCRRFRQTKPVLHKPSYMMPVPSSSVVNGMTILPSGPSINDGYFTLPSQFVRHQQQQQQQQLFFNTLDKNNRSRSLGKGGETTV